MSARDRVVLVFTAALLVVAFWLVVVLAFSFGGEPFYCPAGYDHLQHPRCVNEP